MGQKCKTLNKIGAEPSNNSTNPAPQRPCLVYSAFPSLRGPETDSWTPAATPVVSVNPTAPSIGGGNGRDGSQCCCCGCPSCSCYGSPNASCPVRCSRNRRAAHGISQVRPRWNTIAEKMLLRKPKVCACLAWPIQLCTRGLMSSHINRPCA